MKGKPIILRNNLGYLIQYDPCIDKGDQNAKLGAGRSVVPR